VSNGRSQKKNPNILKTAEEKPQTSPAPTPLEKTFEEKIHTSPAPKARPQLNASPDEILNKLIEDITHIVPSLKDKLQEAIPQSFDGKTLTIIIDAEHDKNDIHQLEKEQQLLDNCLKKVSQSKEAHLLIVRKNEVFSPYDTAPLHSRDIRQLKEKAENNEFVKEIMKTFNGKIIDVWGN
jgi:uncharacterized protein (UPF0335 family)